MAIFKTPQIAHYIPPSPQKYLSQPPLSPGSGTLVPPPREHPLQPHSIIAKTIKVTSAAEKII